MTEKASLVTREMLECKGVWSDEGRSYPTSTSATITTKTTPSGQAAIALP